MKRSIIFPYRSMTIPQITSGAPPSASQGQSYSFQFTETGGIYPFTWSAVVTPNTGGQFSINPVTGLLSGTPGTVENETITVTVSDAMSPHNTATASYTFAVNSAVVVTTGSLPSGTVGAPYSFTLSASGGTPPYTWSMSPSNLDGVTLNTATGVISGTPASATTVTGTFTATDSASIPSAPVSLTLSVTSAGTAPGPQAMWDGWTDSSRIMFAWWPPTTQTDWGLVPGSNGAPNYYKVYRDGSLIGMASPPLTNPGVTPSASISIGQSGFNRPFPWFVDKSVTSGSSHTYTVTAVTGTSESALGPPLTMTALTDGVSAQPAATAAPETWVQPFSLPVGGTTWIVNVLSVGDVAGSGAKGENGCSFQHALNGANPAGGDIIVLTAGLKFPVPNTAAGYTIPAFTGSNGWTYIISSEDPVYKAGGALIPYSYTSSDYGLQPFTCTATIPAGVTSATLSTPWTQKTGWYYVLFTWVTPPSWAAAIGLTTEERLCKFTNGSATVNWLNDGTSSLNPLYPTNGIATLGAITGGSGYTNNPPTQPLGYRQIALTGGSGINAMADAIVVSGGSVTSVTIDPLSGSGYTVGDSLTGTIPGGTGSGFSVQVASVAGHGAGLTAGASATIQVAYLTGVTPTDISAMPTLNWSSLASSCISLSPATNKVRFVGINFQPVLGGQHSTLIGIKFSNSTFNTSPPPCDSIYFDRCVVGNDTNDPGWMSISHGISGINCNHFLVHQTYIWGICNDFAVNSGDANNLGLDGGWHSWQNSYLQCGAENLIYGGAFVAAPPNLPHDIVVRYNMSHKPRSWLQGAPNTNSATGWGIFGKQCKNHLELKAATRAEYYGNLILNNWMGVIQTYHAAAFAMTARDQQIAAAGATNPTQGCPWNRITDTWIHDNQCYYIGSLFYTFTGDASPSTYVARLKVSNNLHLVSPFGQGTAVTERVRAVNLQGPVSDLILDHNTFICNTSALLTGVGAQFGIFWTTPGAGAGGYINGAPATPNGFSQFQDRLTITNNIIDSGIGASTALVPGVTTLDQFVNDFGVSNLNANKNLTISDTTVYGTTPGASYFPGTISHIPYGSIGFKNFQSNTRPPLNPSDWNVVSGTYANDGTDGLALGATLVGTLASDPFPRTRWQVIQPSAAVYAGATFQANAAKFNIVDFGPFMGIEQQGVNFATVFQNIKANSAANGFATPTRCLHYVNSWVSAPVPGQSGGNTSTFTQWESDVNSANWWLRTSYPAGTIVKSPFGGETVNTGVTAMTSANAVTFQPTGASSPLTIFQAFWYHYDGVLRLGNATSQGYAANVALVANPYLDGYQMDNIFAKTRVAGSYTMNTTSQAIGDNAASALNQQGEAQQVAALKAINPALLVMGNCDYFFHSTSANNPVTTLDPSQNNIFDMVYCQVCIGPGGLDNAFTATQLIGLIIGAEAQMSPSGTLIFEQTGRSQTVNWTSASQGSWVAADWQAARYGMAMCFMRNWHYALNANENYSPSSPYFTDETLQQGGKYGWLGAPSDPPQSAARTSGVWWRQFQGGVVFWNPAGNGIQTLTLASLGLTGLNAIASNGFGDATVNTGAPVTSIALQDRDGRFLKNF